MDDERFMREALLEARKAYRKGEVPVGAVIVRDGRVVARAHNMRESSGDPTAHAEILAIRNAARHGKAWRLTGATIYVTLEPCPMCAGALVQARVDCLVYGTRDPKSGAAGSVMDLVRNDSLNHRLTVRAGVLEEECRAILQAFFDELRFR